MLEDTADVVATSAGLVTAAAAGDREAFAALVAAHLPAALGAARLIAGSAADGDDALQEALRSAWLGLRSLRDPVAFPAWFRRQVVRAALRQAGRRRRLVELDPATLADDGLDRAVALRGLDRAFDRLDPKDRLVLVLRHVWELPGAEIAEILGVPEGTVKSRVHAALQRLRAAYDAEERRP